MNELTYQNQIGMRARIGKADNSWRLKKMLEKL